MRQVTRGHIAGKDGSASGARASLVLYSEINTTAGVASEVPLVSAILLLSDRLGSPSTVLPTQLGGGEHKDLQSPLWKYNLGSLCDVIARRREKKSPPSSYQFEEGNVILSMRQLRHLDFEDEDLGKTGKADYFLGASLGFSAWTRGILAESPNHLQSLICTVTASFNILATKKQPETRRPGGQRFIARASASRNPPQNMQIPWPGQGLKSSNKNYNQ